MTTTDALTLRLQDCRTEHNIDPGRLHRVLQLATYGYGGYCCKSRFALGVENYPGSGRLWCGDSGGLISSHESWQRHRNYQ